MASRALFELQKAAFDTSKSLYDRNRAVYRVLRYGVKVRPEAGENTFTVWLVDWKDALANDFGVAEEVTIPGADAKASTKRPDVVLYVNGIALGVLELKRSTVSVSEGSDSARRQFSGTRGAMFLVGLHGLGGDQLFSVAQQDQDASQAPTALRIAVSRFLSGEGRDHVVGVGFLSESGLQPLEAGLVESGGTAYYFPKRESPKWSDDFSGLFTWNHQDAQLGADGPSSSL